MRAWSRRGRWVLTAAMTAIAAHAQANVYAPSVAQMVAQPLVWSIYVVTCVFTVPILAAISLIELAVARKALPQPTAPRRLFRQLFVINAASSLAGFAIPTGVEIVPGLFIAYALTVPVEAFALRRVFGPGSRQERLPSYLLLSVRMNAASYAVIGGLLAAMVYLPGRGTDSPALRARARGLVVTARSSYVVNLNTDPARVTRQPILSAFQLGARGPGLVRGEDGRWTRTVVSPEGWAFGPTALLASIDDVLVCGRDGARALVRKGAKYLIYDVSAERVLREANVAAAFDSWSAITNDGRYALATRSRGQGKPAAGRSAALLDTLTGEAHRVEFDWRLALSPITPEIAWPSSSELRIVRPIAGTTTRLPLPGYRMGDICWSPDGRLILYPGYLNPWTYRAWWTDLRVIDVRTGASTTVARDLFVPWLVGPLVWVAAAAQGH